MVVFIERWLGTVWMVFAVVWFAAALTSKRSVQRQTYGSRALQSSMLLVGILLIFNFLNFSMRGWLETRLIPHTDAWVLAGTVLCVTGILFCFWARAILGTNWSGTVTLKQNHELILHGPYAFVRHPIYTGLLAALLGSAMVYGLLRCFIGVLFCALALWLKSQIEERFMVQQFGDKYRQYRQRTRALVPYVL
jgi:protein-S-isoprenylcysteine O-methyltransferase Ste14